MGYQEDYIAKIAPYVVYFAPRYNVLCPSAVIAQACLETGCGNASSNSNKLCWTYHNHFGIKAGSNWQGGVFKSGTYEGTGANRVYLADGFRTYSTLAEGVENYFQVTSASRYANTRGITDPYTYLHLIGEDGYHTSNPANYANQGMAYVRKYNLTQYDEMTVTTLPNGENSSMYANSPAAEIGDEPPQTFVAQNAEKMNQWGKLRYFEEVSDPSSGQVKANQLLELYCKKTREFKITNAFGDPKVRGGSLIPVRLNLGDFLANNYMLVDKVTHKFSKDSYMMDLTLQGEWAD